MEALRLYTAVVVVVSALIIILLERLIPYTKGQKLLREGFWNDFFWYSLVQSYLMGLLISGLVDGLDSITGLSRLHVMTSYPLWGQVVFFLLTHDLYIYWFHRWQHSNALLWRLHEAHHSTHDVDWLSGMRSHPIEILINQSIEYAPIVLLGASPQVLLLKATFDALWGMYIHSNINVRSGWLQYIINGPEMHRWHHATDTEAHNRNFSTKLAIWDWLFGTAFLPQYRKPLHYGLEESSFPSGYWQQLLFAFRKQQPHSTED